MAGSPAGRRPQQATTSSAPRATSCRVVFHLASRVTGRVTPLPAATSRRALTVNSRNRISAAGSDHRRVGAQGHQAQHRAADQDLVGDRIEDRAPDAGRVQLPGQPAVEEVGHRGDDEGPEGPALQPELASLATASPESDVPGRRRQGQEHEQRQRQAQAGQQIGKAFMHGPN